MGKFKLLGDSAYICRHYPFIVTPKRDNGALSVADQQLNARVSRGRVVVEHAFGGLKCRWRRLGDLQNSRLDVIVKIIVSCCALHNMCIGLAEGACNEHPNGCPRQGNENALGEERPIQEDFVVLFYFFYFHYGSMWFFLQAFKKQFLQFISLICRYSNKKITSFCDPLFEKHEINKHFTK